MLLLRRRTAHVVSFEGRVSSGPATKLGRKSGSFEESDTEANFAATPVRLRLCMPTLLRPVRSKSMYGVGARSNVALCCTVAPSNAPEC